MQLFEGDCLEIMKQIPDASIDLVLCDLPYGITQNKWDSEIPLSSLWLDYLRLCRGAIVLTAAQPFTSRLVMSNQNIQIFLDMAQRSGNWAPKRQKTTLRNHETSCVLQVTADI